MRFREAGCVSGKDVVVQKAPRCVHDQSARPLFSLVPAG